MKFKRLILKFGFESLVGTCVQKGWRIPSREELGASPSSSTHMLVWVSDLPPKEEDRETHAMVLDRENDTLMVCNKSHQQNAVVVIDEKYCTWTVSSRGDVPTYDIGCTEGSEWTDERNAQKFKVCPYCARKIMCSTGV